MVLHRLNHNFDDYFQTFLSRIRTAGFRDGVNEKLKHLGGAWNCATVLDVANSIRSGEDCNTQDFLFSHPLSLKTKLIAEIFSVPQGRGEIEGIFRVILERGGGSPFLFVA